MATICVAKCLNRTSYSRSYYRQGIPCPYLLITEKEFGKKPDYFNIYGIAKLLVGNLVVWMDLERIRETLHSGAFPRNDISLAHCQN
jgi:hypothetical protein